MKLRRSYEWAVPVLAVGAVLVLSATVSDRLPSPLAMHWSTSEPDGAGPLWVVTGLNASLTAVLGLGSVLGASRAPSRFTARGLVAAGHGLSGFLAGIHAWTLSANLDVASWEQADALGVAFLLPFAAAALVGALGWLVAGDRPEPDVVRHAPTPVDVAPGEAVVWVGGARGRFAPWVVAATVGGAFVTWFVLPPGAGAVAAGVLLAVSALLLAILATRVVIGPGGVRATIGRLPWPAVRVPLEEVEGVEVIDVEPLAFGGWGYRVVPGARAIVVRRGEALRVGRRGRADLIVTVDDARTGAGVLLAHLDHAPR